MANLSRVEEINRLFASSPTGPQGYVPAPSAGYINRQVQSPAETQNLPQDTLDYGQWGNQILTMLKKYQQQGQSRLYGAQTEQAQRGLASLPSDISGARLSPSDILGFKKGETNTLEPTIGGARQQISEAGQQISNVQDFLKEIQTQKEAIQTKAADVVKMAIQSGAAGLEQLLTTSPEIFKEAGYSTKEFQAVLSGLKAKEEADKKMGGLTPAQINTTVTQIAGAFDNEPIVKNYNTTMEGYNTLQSIGVKTTNPADDIAFIYAFAKIMDPNSVVREGEYNTIQKYAQSWASTFGFSAKRIFSNTNFLGADAKQKMLTALGSKVGSIQNQYTNLKSEYQRQMNDAYAGKPRNLTSYESGNIPRGGSGDMSETKVVGGVTYKKVPGGWQKVQ